MNNDYSNSSRKITPVMVMPNGQPIYSMLLDARDTFGSEVRPECRKVEASRWTPALVTLAALVIPVALLITRVVTF
jgi:hypothetical protein